MDKLLHDLICLNYGIHGTILCLGLQNFVHQQCGTKSLAKPQKRSKPRGTMDPCASILPSLLQFLNSRCASAAVMFFAHHCDSNATIQLHTTCTANVAMYGY